MRLHNLRDDPRADEYVAEVLPWLHRAGNPYFDWLFGGPEQARVTLEAWMRRPSAEVSIRRVTVLFDDDELVGGYLALRPDELTAARRADTAALMQSTPDRALLLDRLRSVRDLFAPVRVDEFYLSKIGVRAEREGRGYGRRLLESFQTCGRRLGFQRFRLDVSVDNARARRLYELAGFVVASEGASRDGRIEYVAMVTVGGDAE